LKCETETEVQMEGFQKLWKPKTPKSAKTTFSNRAYTQAVKHDHYLLDLTTNQCH